MTGKITAACLVVMLLSGCAPKPFYPTNEELGFNNMCIGIDGVWYPGDPFAPVVNNSGCTRFNVTPLFK